MKKFACFVTCALLMLGVAGVVSAASVAGVDPAAGWTEVHIGMWQRTTTDGRTQTIAQGREGLEAVLADLNAEMVELVDMYLSDPTEELKQVLDTHLQLIASVERGIANAMAKAEEPPVVPVSWCTTDWDADAGGGTSCNNFASGEATYEGSSAADCLGLCDLYAYAYVQRERCNGQIVTSSSSCTLPGVINRTCSAYESRAETARSCSAHGHASISCPTVSYYRSDCQTSPACGTGIMCAACADPGGTGDD